MKAAISKMPLAGAFLCAARLASFSAGRMEALISRIPHNRIVDLMVVVPSHTNCLIMEACAEKVRGRSPGIGFGIFYMSIAKDYIRSAAMVPAGQAIRKQAVRVVTVPVIIVARIVIG